MDRSMTPHFFVPNSSPDDAENVFTGMARTCGAEVPPVGERVYSITFTHDGQLWTATVGQTLRGEERRIRRRRGQRYESTTQLQDPATVLAIFPGRPFYVLTDASRGTAVMSQWANPFMATPDSITLFDQS